MRPPRQVTQSRIARLAGVSQAAVSSVLSGSASLKVSEATREKILKLAAELGYVARKGAAARRENGAPKKQNVLIVEGMPPLRATDEEWVLSAYQTLMGKMLAALGRHLRERDIGLLVFHLDDPAKLIQWLAESDVGGVVWHAADTDTALLHWVASRFPLVMLNKECQADALFDMVSVDHEKNVSLAAEHLWEQGHRRICTFGHNDSISFYRRRMAAYRRFVQEKNLRNYEEFQQISDDVSIPALDKVRRMLEVWQNLGDEAPTGLITSDVFALPLLLEARKLGIRVPRDLSIVGIDNTAPCSLVDPALSSMEQPFDEMCRLAVDVLLRRMENPAQTSHSIQISPWIVSRASVRRVARTSASSELLPESPIPSQT